MRKWREEFGQSVRQVSVRNKSTKDKPGTLPINCYFTKPSEPQPVDFDNLLSMAEIGEDVSEEAEASNEVVEVRPSETTVRTTRSGRTPRPRDQSLYLFYD